MKEASQDRKSRATEFVRLGVLSVSVIAVAAGIGRSESPPTCVCEATFSQCPGGRHGSQAHLECDTCETHNQICCDISGAISGSNQIQGLCFLSCDGHYVGGGDFSDTLDCG
jgi:hypothetical protein